MPLVPIAKSNIISQSACISEKPNSWVVKYLSIVAVGRVVSGSSVSYQPKELDNFQNKGKVFLWLGKITNP